jgi:predicted nucleic acid-binding protein
VKLFLDTSVLLAAAGSATGASQAIFSYAPKQGWELQTSPWVISEVTRNLPKLSTIATSHWLRFRQCLSIVDDVLSLEYPLIFPVSKDRPVIITALAHSNVLLTLDREDFVGMLGSSCYGLPILLPAAFLAQERSAGRLKVVV